MTKTDLGNSGRPGFPGAAGAFAGGAAETDKGLETASNTGTMPKKKGRGFISFEVRFV